MGFQQRSTLRFEIIIQGALNLDFTKIQMTFSSDFPNFTETGLRDSFASPPLLASPCPLLLLIPVSPLQLPLVLTMVTLALSVYREHKWPMLALPYREMTVVEPRRPQLAYNTLYLIPPHI
ncbi:hypothetical protein DsansV1_C18g0150841 [Dioscorea sansibarensis]